MRALSINLATQPFRRDRPVLIASLAVAVLMTATLAMLLFLVWVEKDEGRETARAIEQARGRLDALVAEERRLTQVLMKPENAAVLERSLFLNELLARKGISWTLIFQDLEEVVPHNVKLVQIRPQLRTDPQTPDRNEVLLEMVVASQSAEPVIDLLRALESSPRFGATAISAAFPPTETEPLYRYRVSVRYARPL
jgi:type IV pilus assembly protein PilN